MENFIFVASMSTSTVEYLEIANKNKSTTIVPCIIIQNSVLNEYEWDRWLSPSVVSKVLLDILCSVFNSVVWSWFRRISSWAVLKFNFIYMEILKFSKKIIYTLTIQTPNNRQRLPRAVTPQKIQILQRSRTNLHQPESSAMQ